MNPDDYCQLQVELGMYMHMYMHMHMHAYLQAQTLLQLGRYGDTVATCEGALLSHPRTTCLHTMLANAYLKTGHPSQVRLSK